jgi:hypothetical protein
MQVGRGAVMRALRCCLQEEIGQSAIVLPVHVSSAGHPPQTASRTLLAADHHGNIGCWLISCRGRPEPVQLQRLQVMMMAGCRLHAKTRAGSGMCAPGWCLSVSASQRTGSLLAPCAWGLGL